MLAATHIIFGAGCSLLYGNMMGMGPEQIMLVTATGAVGSLLPDVDTPTSTFGKKIRPISDIISFVFGHRGITHSLLMVGALIFVLIHYIDMPSWVYGLIFGYLSHLLGDWITPSGIPLFWPLKRRYRSPIAFKTGSFVEFFFGAVFLMGGITWYFQR